MQGSVGCSATREGSARARIAVRRCPVRPLARDEAPRSWRTTRRLQRACSAEALWGGRFSGRLAGPAAGLERQLPTQGGQSASTADEQEFRGSGRWISDSERAVPVALQSFRFAQDRSRRRTLGDPGPHHVSTWISTIGGHAPSTQKMHRDWRGRPLLRAGSHIKSWQKIRRHERQLGRSWEQ